MTNEIKKGIIKLLQFTEKEIEKSEEVNLMALNLRPVSLLQKSLANNDLELVSTMLDFMEENNFIELIEFTMDYFKINKE